MKAHTKVRMAWLAIGIVTLYLALRSFPALAAPPINCSAMRVIAVNSVLLKEQGYTETQVRTFVQGEMNRKPGLTRYERTVILKVTGTAFHLPLGSEEYGDFIFEQCVKNTFLQRSSYPPAL